MAAFDIILLIVIILSVMVGWARGFIKELMSLLSWGAAFYAAYLFYQQAADFIEPYLPIEKPLSLIVGYIVVFLITLLVAAIISYLMSSIFESIGLKGLDRALGSVFGVLRGVVIIAIFILFAINFGLTRSDWYQNSKLVVNVEPIAESIYQLLPNNITDHFAKDELSKDEPRKEVINPVDIFNELQDLESLTQPSAQ